ncbi:hypothetical protein ACFQVC_23410 [Streptomyces monticola]|uniref:Glycosyltransferase family 2 protein n=1 Tax=Streptomyces monticola TaxID=2666263 RepID=A0ABW2JM04_9ACTN
MEVPQTLRAIWAQRTRWSRGQGEVLRTHIGTVRRLRHWPLWPIALEALLSYVWVLLLFISTVYGLVHWIRHPDDAQFRWLPAWGVGIAVIAMIQIAVATLIDVRLDPKLPYACLLLPLYPLAYWTINALAALFAQTQGLIRGPRAKRWSGTFHAAPTDPRRYQLAPAVPTDRRHGRRGCPARLVLRTAPRTRRHARKGCPDSNGTLGPGGRE